MSQPMNVSPEALVASGAVVDEHSQRIFAEQSMFDAVLESALPGWIGRSHAALTATAAQWADYTTAMAERLYEHGEGLRISGLSFAEMDREHAGALNLRG